MQQEDSLVMGAVPHPGLAITSDDAFGELEIAKRPGWPNRKIPDAVAVAFAWSTFASRLRIGRS